MGFKFESCWISDKSRPFASVSENADTLLIKALSSDADAAVRLEAAVVLGFHEANINSFTAQKRAFINDTAESVRLEILQNLWKARNLYPEVRQLIKQSAAQDKAKTIREKALSIINAYPEYF